MERFARLAAELRLRLGNSSCPTRDAPVEWFNCE